MDKKSVLAPSQKANQMQKRGKNTPAIDRAELAKKVAGILTGEGSVKVEEKDPTPQADEDDRAEYQMGFGETFADYKPAKLKFGQPHPDPVVETSSLSSVEPVDITYQLKLPKRSIDEGKLSALQLESIVYASQAHACELVDGSRAGFLIGMSFCFPSTIFKT